MFEMIIAIIMSHTHTNEANERNDDVQWCLKGEEWLVVNESVAVVVQVENCCKIGENWPGKLVVVVVQ